MQVSRTSNYEEMGRMKIADFEKPLGNRQFDKLLEKLDIDDISQEDKELYLSILFDKKVTKEEFHSLSYEQVQKLTEFSGKSDLEGNALAESFFIYEGLELAPFLATPHISDDENYNKAIFNVLKNLNLSQEEGISFINEVMGGVRDIDEVRAFENRLTQEQYASGVRYKTYIGQDMQELLLNRLASLEQGLSKTDDETVKKDYEFYINVYNQIQSEYETINLEKKFQLEQYTRNTRVNPIYNSDVVNLYNKVSKEYEQKDKEEFEQLLDKLGVTNLSQSEKELFRTILEDDEFSNIEMDNLSFEQMQKISQLISQKDSNGNFIDETSTRYSSKTAALLSTTTATKDDDFNKALFDTVKQMDDINEINDFLLPFMNHISQKIEEYSEFIELDMNDIIDELIGKFQENSNKSEYYEIKEHYKGMIEKYSDFKEYYNKLKKD